MNRTSLLVLPMIGALTAVAGTTCRDGVAGRFRSRTAGLP